MIVEKHFIPSSLGNDKKIKLVIKTNNNYQNPLFICSGRSLPYEVAYDLKYDGKSAIDLMLEANLTIIYIDFIGMGESSDFDEDHGIGNTYDDVVRDIFDAVTWLKQNKNIDTFSFLATSGSSIPVLMFVAQNPALVDKVVVNGIPKTSKEEWEEKNLPLPKYAGDKYKINLTTVFYRKYRDLPQDRISEFVPDSWCELQYNTIHNHESAHREYHNGFDYDRFKMINGEKTLGDFIKFDKIKCPILFYQNEWDRDLSLKNIEECMKKISSNYIKTVVIPEASHWVMQETGRTRAIDILSKFVINLEV